ncbi:hypothetical protein JOB18_010212 [Solea senegalensis]|uniref:Uncharacterized protein n=1 Tax=Solea senegalensis TaxID=28829 RepID=A0AAV6RGW6_SOLSE|nr:hypothetical protein JOB18_010212 [Solea senegalensis]
MLCVQTSSNCSTPAHKKAIKYLQLTESRAIQLLLDCTGAQPNGELWKRWSGASPASNETQSLVVDQNPVLVLRFHGSYDSRNTTSVAGQAACRTDESLGGSSRVFICSPVLQRGSDIGFGDASIVAHEKEYPGIYFGRDARQMFSNLRKMTARDSSSNSEGIQIPGIRRQPLLASQEYSGDDLHGDAETSNQYLSIMPNSSAALLPFTGRPPVCDDVVWYQWVSEEHVKQLIAAVDFNI